MKPFQLLGLMSYCMPGFINSSMRLTTIKPVTILILLSITILSCSLKGSENGNNVLPIM